MEPADGIAGLPVETPQASTTFAIAVNADQSALPAAVFMSDDQGSGAFPVPAGSWYVITYAAGTGARRSHAALVSGRTTPLRLDQATEQVPDSVEEQTTAFTALLTYLVDYQRAYLASLDALSSGFGKELLGPAATMTADQAEAVNLALDDVDAAAPDALGAQRTVATRAFGPSFGLFDWTNGRIQDPIHAQARAQKARLDVALAFGRMTIPQQQAAFHVLTQEVGMDLGIVDSASFIEKLDDGDYDNRAAQTQNRLQNNADYFDYFDGKGWDLVETLEQRLQQAKTVVTQTNSDSSGTAVFTFARGTHRRTARTPSTVRWTLISCSQAASRTPTR